MLDFINERVFYYFQKISSIPRESGNEKAVSDWIYNWTKTLGLEAAQDAAFNLVIKKKASAGYEKAAPVILQAHMDMVCEKTPDSSHDFAKDPILLQVDGDWLCSASGTSLGADNGIGMAYAMAVLEDDSLAHPPIEVIFTVEEETTFKGADSVSGSLFKGKRMINLDHANDRELIAGSCGGTGVHVTLPLQWEEEIPEGYQAYKIKVCGLKGGHSGEDIHRGRGNAIELLIRLLHGIDLRVISINGGTNRLAIPREAEAVVLVKDTAVFLEQIMDIRSVFRREFSDAAPDLDVTAESVQASCPMKQGEFEKIAAIVKLCPNGIVDMNGELQGLVNSSNNLGILQASSAAGVLFITCEIRGLYQSMVDEIKNRIELLADLFGAKVDYFSQYVSWEYEKDSLLRKTALAVYRDLFQEEMSVYTIHAGLECGMFKEKVPDMDIISIGPTCQFFHSPNERVSIHSVRKTYQLLTALLARL